MTAGTGEPRVVDDPAAARYEISVDGALAGFADYRLEPGAVVVVHAEIAPELRRRGLGGALARGVLDDIRERGLRIVPRCPFFASYLRDHDEYRDLVA